MQQQALRCLEEPRAEVGGRKPTERCHVPRILLQQAPEIRFSLPMIAALKRGSLNQSMRRIHLVRPSIVAPTWAIRIGHAAGDRNRHLIAVKEGGHGVDRRGAAAAESRC
jgi:hypothetical protein